MHFSITLVGKLIILFFKLIILHFDAQALQIKPVHIDNFITTFLHLGIEIRVLRKQK